MIGRILEIYLLASSPNMEKEMFNALVSLYQSENIDMKMIFHNKLRYIKMMRSNIVTSYLIKVTHICDQLAIVGEKV